MIIMSALKFRSILIVIHPFKSCSSFFLQLFQVEISSVIFRKNLSIRFECDLCFKEEFQFDAKAL